MNRFTNEEKNDKMKKENAPVMENSQKSNSNNEGISRFLYQTPENQKNTVSQNNYYYPVNNSLQIKPFTVAPKADDISSSASYTGLNQKSETSNIYKPSGNLNKKIPEIKPYSNDFNTPKNDRVYDNAYDAYKENPKNSYPKATVKKENYNYNDMKVKPEKSYSNTNAAKYLSESFGEYLKQNQKRRDANLKVIQDSISSLQKKNKTTSDSQTRRATSEDIYNPETLIASPENLRSNVSLYGKSPADMNKKYSYENGELKVSTDNDYPLIAKANSLLSKSSRELNDYFEKELKNNNPINEKEYQDILNEYVSKTDLRKDTSQYAIFKLLRALNNNYYNPSPKNSEVVKFIASALEKISKPSVTNEAMRKSFNKAMNYTKNNADYNETVKAWFDVFVKYSEIEEKYQDSRNDFISGTQITSGLIDNGINQIIYWFNNGKSNADVFVPNFIGGNQSIYSTETGWNDYMPVREIEENTSMSTQGEIIDKKYK